MNEVHKVANNYAYCYPQGAFIETLVAAGEGAITLKGREVGNQAEAAPKSIMDKVVAIPFPVLPRRLLYGQSAKILDFIEWKQRHILEANSEADHSANGKSLEELEKLSIAEQQIWVIRKLFKIYDSGGQEDLHKVYKILCEKSPDSA